VFGKIAFILSFTIFIVISFIAYEKEGKVVFSGKDDVKDAIASGKVWINIEHPTDEDMDLIEEHFGLDKLCIEDIKNQIHRAKVEEYDRYIYVNLHSPKLREGRFRRTEHDFVIGENFLITNHHSDFSAIDDIRKRIENDVSVFSKGLDFVMYYVINSIVDSYFPVLEKIDDDIDDIEEEVFKSDSKELLKKMIEIKRLVLDLKRIAGPEREVINLLTKEDSPYFSKRSILHFKDVYDRIHRVGERADSSRDLVTSSMEAYLSMLSMRMNEVIERLTVIFTITIPPTLVATFYGMNFAKLPLSSTNNGFFVVVMISLLISITMTAIFKKKGWF